MSNKVSQLALGKRTWTRDELVEELKGRVTRAAKARNDAMHCKEKRGRLTPKEHRLIYNTRIATLCECIDMLEAKTRI